MTIHNDSQIAATQQLKELIRNLDAAFFPRLREETLGARQFGQVLSLHNLRKRAEIAGLVSPHQTLLRVAMVGGATLRPLADFADHFTSVLCDAKIELLVGEYDSYMSEIMDPHSELYEFKPNVILVLPASSR